jgi:hypothetical protein
MCTQTSNIRSTTWSLEFLTLLAVVFRGFSIWKGFMLCDLVWRSILVMMKRVPSISHAVGVRMENK